MLNVTRVIRLLRSTALLAAVALSLLTGCTYNTYPASYSGYADDGPYTTSPYTGSPSYGYPYAGATVPAGPYYPAPWTEVRSGPRISAW